MQRGLIAHGQPLNTRVSAYFAYLLAEQNRLFWFLQIVGWAALSLLTYVSLSLPWDQLQIEYLAHNILQSVLGLVVSTPLRYVSQAAWNMPPVKRLIILIASTLTLALVWSVGRLGLFLMLTNETGLWNEFGGWFYPSVFVFLCWVALYHGIKFYQLFELERANLLKLESLQRAESLRTVKLEHAAKAAQLRLLRYQLNPHFLFNTLNSVSSLIESDRRGKAKEMLFSLSEFLRYSLRSDIWQNYRLADEIAAIDLYLGIEQIRFGDRLRIEKQIDPTTLDCEIPGFILQPLLENSIKYAVAQRADGGCIRISAQREPGCVLLRVEDTGPPEGVVKERQSSGEGVGLNNIRERLLALYGGDGKLTISGSPLGGWAVVISIPCSTHEGAGCH